MEQALLRCFWHQRSHASTHCKQCRSVWTCCNRLTARHAYLWVPWRPTGCSSWWAPQAVKRQLLPISNVYTFPQAFNVHRGMHSTSVTRGWNSLCECSKEHESDMNTTRITARYLHERLNCDLRGCTPMCPPWCCILPHACSCMLSHKNVCMQSKRQRALANTL
jgi:hypothetical protein